MVNYNMENWDWFVHGLWVLGSVFFFLGGLIAGNLEWVLGTTLASYGISAALAFVMFLLAGMSWISASVNARNVERMACRKC